MRFAIRVTPRNNLLFACHLTNFTLQSIQGVRCAKYKYVFGVNFVWIIDILVCQQSYRQQKGTFSAELTKWYAI